MNLYIVYGGKSVEHEVSLQTAKAVINSFDKQKYNVYPIYITKDGVWCCLGLLQETIKDTRQLVVESNNDIASSLGDFLLNHISKREKNIVFPLIHGTNGEDGKLQGLLELLNIPYVGNHVLSSAIGFDKVLMKDMFTLANIPQTKYIAFLFHDWMEDALGQYDKVEAEIGYPCFVKPACLGSSVGISRCTSRGDLEQAVEKAFMYDEKIIIEQEIVGREMQVAVIGNDEPLSSVVGEYIQERSFMDYDAKYVDGKLIPIIPARIPIHIHEEMREIAIRAFKALTCSGLLRVDYFVTKQDEVYVNEVNTLPGFTEYSMFPALWEKTDGTSYSELIEKLIDFGIKRHEELQMIKYSR